LASVAAFLCLMLAHLLCPAMSVRLPDPGVPRLGRQILVENQRLTPIFRRTGGVQIGTRS
jgi:hypothetical protein